MFTLTCRACGAFVYLGGAQDPVTGSIPNRHLSELEFGLTTRVINALACRGVYSTNELCALSIRDVRRLRNFGEASLLVVRRGLASIGRHLIGDSGALTEFSEKASHEVQA